MIKFNKGNNFIIHLLKFEIDKISLLLEYINLLNLNLKLLI